MINLKRSRSTQVRSQVNHPTVQPHIDHLRTQEIEFNPKIEAERQASAATRISLPIGNQAIVTTTKTLAEDHTIVNAITQEDLLAALMHHSLPIVITIVATTIIGITRAAMAEITLASEIAVSQLTSEVSKTHGFDLTN